MRQRRLRRSFGNALPAEAVMLAAAAAVPETAAASMSNLASTSTALAGRHHLRSTSASARRWCALRGHIVKRIFTHEL